MLQTKKEEKEEKIKYGAITSLQPTGETLDTETRT
jgi:hypothetical protein